MALHPNRIGGLRGNAGDTLKQTNSLLTQILNKLDDLQAAVLAGNNHASAIETAIGAPDDTDCGNSLLASLCGVLAVLGEDGGAGGGPPAHCPGFPDAPSSWWYANSFTPYDAGGVPSDYQFYPEWVPSGNPSSLYVEVAEPFPGVPSYTFLAVRTTANLTNICISFRKPGGDYQVLRTLYNAADYSVLGQDTVAGATTMGEGSYAMTLDADQAVGFSVVSPTSDPVDVAGLEMWIVRGANG